MKKEKSPRPLKKGGKHWGGKTNGNGRHYFGPRDTTAVPPKCIMHCHGTSDPMAMNHQRSCWTKCGLKIDLSSASKTSGSHWETDRKSKKTLRAVSHTRCSCPQFRAASRSSAPHQIRRHSPDEMGICSRHLLLSTLAPFALLKPSNWVSQGPVQRSAQGEANTDARTPNPT